MKVKSKQVDISNFSFNNINGAPADNLFIICTLRLHQLKRRFSLLRFLFTILLQICIIMYALSFVGSTCVALYIVSSVCLFEVESKRLVDFKYGMKMWHNWTEASLEKQRGRLPKVIFTFFPLIQNCSIRTSQSAIPSKSKDGTTGLSVVCILGCSSMKIIGMGACGATPGSTLLLGTAG